MVGQAGGPGNLRTSNKTLTGVLRYLSLSSPHASASQSTEALSHIGRRYTLSRSLDLGINVSSGVGGPSDMSESLVEYATRHADRMPYAWPLYSLL